MSNQLLDGYQAVKGVAGSGKKTPIVKFVAEGEVLVGVLLAKKTFKDQEGKDKLIVTLKASECTANLIIKGNAGYMPHTFVAGEDVTIYGPSARLERALMAIEDGGVNEVKIVYEGKKKELVRGKNMNVHSYKVGKKPAAVVAAVEDAGVPD